jgi:ribulose 1,5-bisphosphate synthetase/thiazole synthase
MLKVTYGRERLPAAGPTLAGLFDTPSNSAGAMLVEAGTGGSGIRPPEAMREPLGTVLEGPRRIPVIADVDVLVCGGGPAGTAASIAAARHGATTLLLERDGYLGGMASGGLVVPHFNPHNNRGINSEMVAALQKSGSWGAEFWKISFDPERWKHVSESLVLESGSDLLLHAVVVGAIVEDGHVRGVVFESKSGRFAVLAKVIVDATGDADVAAFAGADYHLGRDGDGAVQSMTTMFRLGGVNWVQRGPHELWDLVADATERTGSSYRLPFDRPWAIHLPNPGEVAVQLTHMRGVDGTDVRQLTRAEIEGRRQSAVVADFLRDNVPEFAHSHLIDTAAQVGVRETRRIIGDYTLTAEDVLAGRFFHDGIASVSFPIDIHESDDFRQVVREVAVNRRGAYDIPYRSLLPAGLEGILVAGRPISGTHEAHASYRVKGPCMAMGQAAGTAAALAAAKGVDPRGLSAEDVRRALADDGVKIWPEVTRSGAWPSHDHEPMNERRRSAVRYMGPG